MIDRLALATAPIVMGAEGLPWCGPLGRRRLARAVHGRIVERAGLGPDALVVVDLGSRGA